MRRKILASLLLAGALSGLYRLGAQTPEPVALTVRPTESKEFTFKQVDRDVYEVTTAPGSAVIRFEPVKGSLAEGISVLSFDYFCASGMEFMVVMVNDDRSRIEENMIRLPIAEGWSTFSVDVTDKLKRLQGPDDYLSLLIVPNAARPTTMRIRNARLRAYTEKEREQARLKTERERREKQLNADIEVYLKKNYPCEVSRVTVNDDRVEVSGDIKGMPGEVYLCEVPMFRELTEKDFLTVQRVKGPKKFKADFDRYAEVDGQRYDRLYSRWVLAQKSQNGMLICSHGHYADDVKAKYDLPREVPASKKGIGGFGANRFASDLDSLDITSVTVNMWLGFMSLTPSDDAIPFDYNGRTYYADRKAIEGFDKTLQYTAARDVIVNAIVLIAPERSFADKAAGRLFEHPEHDDARVAEPVCRRDRFSGRALQPSRQKVRSRASLDRSQRGRCGLGVDQRGYQDAAALHGYLYQVDAPVVLYGPQVQPSSGSVHHADALLAVAPQRVLLSVGSVARAARGLYAGRGRFQMGRRSSPLPPVVVRAQIVA